MPKRNVAVVLDGVLVDINESWVDGEPVGANDGIRLGTTDGVQLGILEGARLGTPVGVKVGFLEGAKLGISVGALLGFCVGATLGLLEGDRLLNRLGAMFGQAFGVERAGSGVFRPRPTPSPTAATAPRTIKNVIPRQSRCPSGVLVLGKHCSSDWFGGATKTLDVGSSTRRAVA